MNAEDRARLAAALGCPVADARPLGSGGAKVTEARLADGRRVAVKTGGDALALEARALRYLAERTALPVPGVLHEEPGLLALEWIETGTPGPGRAIERHAADLLAALHDISAPAFGLDFDTAIGGLAQPNGWHPRWLPFFAERRLLFMARAAHAAGRLDRSMLARVESLAGRLARWLDEPLRPSLVHGDVWAGNVLARGGRIAAFIDPAIHYADADVELAFIRLFDTFGAAFFERYESRRAMRPGFDEARRDLYNLYPLLVHARLFGGRYVYAVDRILNRFGA